MVVDQAARAAGLTCGMGLAQARAMVPAVQVAPHAPVADLRMLDRIADWADRYTPLVGRAPPDGLLLDITGAAHLLGGEGALRADLLDRLASQGFAAAVAIAPTPGAAWALSRCETTPIIPGTATRADLDAALAPLPVAGLRLPPDTIAALVRVGLKHIGDLIGRPRAALAARFGASLILRLDQARGIDSEAISPRQPVPPAIVDLGFVEPVLTAAAIVRACQHLAERLCALLTERGEGATVLTLAVWRVDGLVKRVTLRLASPSRNAETLAGLLALRLDHLDDPLDPGFGYDLVRLSATTVAVCAAEARALPGVGIETGLAGLARARAALLDRLTARFGPDRIQACVLADTHIPERSARIVPVDQTSLLRQPVSPLAGRAGKKRREEHAGQQLSPDAVAPLARHRPLRLLDPPEPVEVMAEVPDGPPLHLRWRRRPLRIVAAHGPERIAPEWWQPAALAAPPDRDRTRDYWRIEDASGRRLWLYREGQYGLGGVGEAATPRWYVHGLFA
jgi:protein ImuB